MAGGTAQQRLGRTRAASWDNGGLMASQLHKQTAAQFTRASEHRLNSKASVFTQHSPYQEKELQFRQCPIKLPLSSVCQNLLLLS